MPICGVHVQSYGHMHLSEIAAMTDKFKVLVFAILRSHHLLHHVSDWTMT